MPKSRKEANLKWQEFGIEPRHLHLGLAMDGVNRFGHRSTSWSMWPVVVIIYNIPPWLNIKKGHIMLALIGLGMARYMIHSLGPLTGTRLGWLQKAMLRKGV